MNATYQSLLNSACNSCEIFPDKSAYWTPNLYYQRPNGSFEEVQHGGSVVYYLGRGYLQDGSQVFTPFPKGFQMLSGNKATRAYNTTGMTWGNATYPNRPIQDAATFLCIGDILYPAGYNLQANSSCNGGLRAQLHFQSCWNGVDLYKSDNSHVAYLSQMDNGVCPPGFPKLLPHIFLETDYSIDTMTNLDDGGQFLWSMGDPTGYGYHGDFQNGWDMAIQANAVANCISDAGFGTIEECPILQANRNTQFASNCPQMPSQVDEPVHGMIAKLPGCIEITYGPAPAAASQMSCGTGAPQPAIFKTVDSSPRPTANPAIGSVFGNAYNQYVGCGNDTYGSPGGLRTLNAATYNDNNMTVEKCQTFCTNAGYRYSGIEYQTQCYCDLALNPSAVFYAGVNMSVGCSMLCPGNSYELCGGPSYMTIFNNTDPKFVPTNSTANSVIQLTAPIKPLSSNYIGCYSDQGPRTLNGTTTSSGNMSVEACATFCSTANYPYYGTEYSSQCFCGFGYSSGTFLDTSANVLTSQCNYRCTGDFGELCGGSGTISVYRNPGYVPVVSPKTVGKYTAKNCLTDPGTHGRALAASEWDSATNMTVENCVAYCKGKGYKYAG